jgi:hypothetical protein
MRNIFQVKVTKHSEHKGKTTQFHIILYIYLTAVGLTPGGSSTKHIYRQTVHIIQRKENNTEKEKLGSVGRAPSL